MKPNQSRKHFTRLHEDMFNEDIAEFQRLAGEIIEGKVMKVKLQKTKYRSRLILESDLRCSQSSTKPRISNLVKAKQLHPLH